MRINDVPAPRILLVWEDLIGRPRRDVAVSSRLWRERLFPTWALRHWVTDAVMTSRMRDADLHSAYALDVITFFGRRAADVIESRMRAEHVSFSEMFYADAPEDLFHMNTGHLGIYTGCDAYGGMLGEGEIFLWHPDNFDLPA